MSQSGTLPREHVEHRPERRPHSPLRELFAPLPDLLACGGDLRIDVDPLTGRNAYGCATQPSEGSAGFASCTASTISPRGYEAAERARTALMSSAMLHGLIECFDARVEALRDELKNLLGIARSGAEAIFTASGSDAQLTVLAISRALLGDDVTTLVVAADQTGTATTYTARGQHFSGRTANDAAVVRGDNVCGLGAVRSVAVRLRDADGHLRAASAVDADILEQVETIVAEGGRVMLEAMDSSKLGYSAPSERCLAEIAARWPGRVQIVIDACQMRLGPARIAAHLARGALVLITGSKFYGGPAFSGAVLVPPQIGARLIAAPLAVGLDDYMTRSDWPARWTSVREQFRTAPNFGQWLRWEAAIAEMRAYHAVPEVFRRSAMRALGSGLARLITASPSLRLVPALVQVDRDDEFALPSIFAFTLQRNGRALDLKQCRATYTALTTDDAPSIVPDAFTSPSLIGQPVGWGGPADDRVAALRMCIGARHIIDAWSAPSSATDETLSLILDNAADVVARIETLLSQPDTQLTARNVHA
ncbi:hypothetical protein [Rhodopseudomonas sp. B29]|uniref:hypothetical protein n=1 Tax=Rhodopseudomonas sp. B29 TaxID=95607 RepID=UPI0003B4FB1C|nr:hypothetical protein [Rhodopseudomonas sp. B29]